MGASTYISIIARLLLSAVGMATVIFFKLAPELGLPIDPEMDVRIVQVEWSQVKPWVSFLFLFLFLLFSVCALALPHLSHATFSVVVGSSETICEPNNPQQEARLDDGALVSACICFSI